MKAVQLKQTGGAEHFYIGECPTPPLNKNQILVKVHATAINRADILQREGKYPAPNGASEILGLEIAGEVANSNNTQWQEGDKVFGLVPGGAYAEYCVIDQDMAMPIPNSLNYEQAAAIPEAFLTAYQALVWLADVKSGEKVLIHAGGSGVGTAAIQIVKLKGAECIITASSSKHDLCRTLGADLCIDYKSENFEEVIKRQYSGVNVVIDFLAASYLKKNINVLSTDGRMVMLALMGGIKSEINLAPIVTKRLKIMGSTLRSRSLSYQQQLTKDIAQYALPLLELNLLKPIIDKVLNWQNVAEAHRYMEANKNKGKIVLKIR